MRDPELLKRRSVWQWQWRDSPQPREHHKNLDQKCFPADADVWKAIHPSPFGCRCVAFALSDRDLEREGLTLSDPPSLKSIAEPGFSTGFAANLDDQRIQLISDAVERLPPNLAKLLEDDTDFAEDTLDYAFARGQRRDARGRWTRTGGSAASSVKVTTKEAEGIFNIDIKQRIANREAELAKNKAQKLTPEKINDIKKVLLDKYEALADEEDGLEFYSFLLAEGKARQEVAGRVDIKNQKVLLNVQVYEGIEIITERNFPINSVADLEAHCDYYAATFNKT